MFGRDVLPHNVDVKAVYALAAGGEAGVDKMLAMLETELTTSMALVGAASVAELGRHHVQLPGEAPPRLPVHASASGGYVGGGLAAKL